MGSSAHALSMYRRYTSGAQLFSRRLSRLRFPWGVAVLVGTSGRWAPREVRRMGARELTALGTGSFLPTRTRNHSGYMLRWGRRGILLGVLDGSRGDQLLGDVLGL